MDDLDYISAAVRLRRKQLGYTQSQLADLARVTVRWVSAFESNEERGFNFTKVLDVLKILKLRVVLESVAQSNAKTEFALEKWSK